MRRELFCNIAHDNLGSACNMASYSEFMHIAFQVLPITETILRGEFVAENFQRLEDCVRRFAGELSNLTMAVIAHDSEGKLLPLSFDSNKHRALVQSLDFMGTYNQHFLENFDNLALGVFARQLSLCLWSVVSLAAKFAWDDIVLPALEGYLYRTMDLSNSETNIRSTR